MAVGQGQQRLPRGGNSKLSKDGVTYSRHPLSVKKMGLVNGEIGGRALQAIMQGHLGKGQGQTYLSFAASFTLAPY